MAKCRCDARYEGCAHGPDGCEKVAGTAWGPYFCTTCDLYRLTHISENLRRLKETRALEIERG